MNAKIAPKTGAGARATARKSKPLYKDLLFQVIFAVFLGIAFGIIFPSVQHVPNGQPNAGSEIVATCHSGFAADGKCLPNLAENMKPLGDAFVNLIKMLIAPIIFCTIVSGIAGMGDAKQVGRVGVKAIVIFTLITTIALAIGWAVAEFEKPGSGMTPPSSVSKDMQSKIAGAHMSGASDFLLHMIPQTMVGAFSDGEILQVLVVAILFALALAKLGESCKKVHAFIDDFSHVLFKMVDLVTVLAPIGAFGAMAFTIGKYGIGSLGELAVLLTLFYGSGLLFILFVLGPIMYFYCRLSMLGLIKFISEELIIVLGTSSSETVLPRMMEKMAALGCSKQVVSFTIPAGYSFNLVGSSLYFTMGAIFVVYATGTPMTFMQELGLFGILLITSKGAAGVTGSAFIVLTATLSSMGVIPPDKLAGALAQLYAIDRFMSTGRAIVNLIGNAVATIIVAKWENALDYKLAHSVLSGKSEADLTVLER